LAAGHNAPGYYLIDAPTQFDTQQYEVVKCNMRLETSNAQFQQTTGVRLNKHMPLPIAFDYKRTAVYNTVGIVPYTTALLNLGNAMSTNGIFTVPVDGTYQFTFTGSKSKHDAYTRAALHVDSSEVGLIQAWSADDNLSVNVIVKVRKGQQVYVYLKSGQFIGIPEDQNIHFTGHLLYLS
jgi:hypothetical protein